MLTAPRGKAAPYWPWEPPRCAHWSRHGIRQRAAHPRTAICGLADSCGRAARFQTARFQTAGCGLADSCGRAARFRRAICAPAAVWSRTERFRTAGCGSADSCGRAAVPRFRVVDRIFTNFHTPCSTLLMMISAFCGRERILSAYEEAVNLKYRFFSYGDAMLIH
ncbi:MAG: hypothetical protein CSA76_05770 [Spirochaetales bacterium]|nr:MAG: hypothetical protein CSA76_05770 [Spirochaetales bacterium]